MESIFKYFNAIAASIVLIFSLSLLCFCHSLSTEAKDVLKGTAGLSAFFLWGSTAGSQKKDADAKDQTNNLITSLSNSTPIKPPVEIPATPKND